MLLVGNREQEILARATNRKVTTIVNMSAPGVDPGSLHGMFGMIVEKRRPAIATDEVHAQSAHMWQTDDTCEAVAEKNPRVMMEVLRDVAQRMKGLESGGALSRLRLDSQKVVFDSADLVDKANGLPLRLSVSFDGAATDATPAIMGLPFPKIQSFLLKLDDGVRSIGGRLHSADIVHSASMSAFDYYEMAIKEYMPGKKFTYGDVMLARATALLRDVGMPFVAPKPAPKPH